MNRRALLSLAVVAAALAGQVRAEEPVARILSDLRRLGYQTVSVESTLLRRTRIVAQSDEALREIIVNPNTGEVLRDLWTPIKKTSSGKSDGVAGSGSGSDDDDDDDDDGDNSGHGGDGDGDNSGHGGGDNSGKGGGGDDGDD